MRLLSMVMAGLLVGTGCAANSYKIPANELQRLAMLPPEVRSQRVLVSQELGGTDVEAADPVTSETQIIFVPDLSVGGGGRGGHGGGGRAPVVGHGGGGGGMHLGGGGDDGKAMAVAVLVIAAVALVAVAAVEGSRFDGWVRLHPMHPVHLIGQDGSQTVMPLAWIDPQAAAWTRSAIVKSNEGPWLQLDRKPLTRGGTYSMYGGYGSTRSVYGDVGSGPSFVVQAGYFPEQHIGILANLAFAWRDNRDGGTLFESRYMLELQALPLVVGPIHLGGYVGGGLAYRWEDTTRGTVMAKGNDGSNAYAAGAMLQLDVHTRIALTARLGAVHAHDDRMTDLLFGISVY